MKTGSGSTISRAGTAGRSLAPLGSEPFFSADGEWLGFFSAYFENSVFKVPVAGGLRQRICTLSSGEWPDGFAWRGDWIVFSIRDFSGERVVEESERAAG